MVKDLIATVQREDAQIGLFVTLANPTEPMKKEAVSAGLSAPAPAPKSPLGDAPRPLKERAGLAQTV